MTTQKNWGVAPFTVTLKGGETFTIAVGGRDRWALENLLKAGERGCTAIDTPAPRMSAYMFNLRRMGVHIETVTEAHTGPFSGHHARYVIRCDVERQVEGNAHEA